ncbi:hypothetical protein [Phreatobacter sp.]|uniref:hypothetical protein n=1 Tax=Phreatobacter sp. TaxID=1966341 RepID=UPI003F708D7C
MTYLREDEWHGELHVFAKARGFAARASAWFNRDTLIDFARALSQYPLPSTPPLTISGGVGALEADQPDLVRVGLAIAPAGARGQLLVRIELASDPQGEVVADVQQRASISFPTEYAALERFRISLEPMLDGDGEALLSGTEW